MIKEDFTTVDDPDIYMRFYDGHLRQSKIKGIHPEKEIYWLEILYGHYYLEILMSKRLFNEHYIGPCKIVNNLIQGIIIK